jgi:hypothetical protein
VSLPACSTLRTCLDKRCGYFVALGIDCRGARGQRVAGIALQRARDDVEVAECSNLRKMKSLFRRSGLVSGNLPSLVKQSDGSQSCQDGDGKTTSKDSN